VKYKIIEKATGRVLAEVGPNYKPVILPLPYNPPKGICLNTLRYPDGHK